MVGANTGSRAPDDAVSVRPKTLPVQRLAGRYRSGASAESQTYSLASCLCPMLTS